MRAAYILKEEYGIETRIVNLHTVKPVDKEALVRAAEHIAQRARKLYERKVREDITKQSLRKKY